MTFYTHSMSGKIKNWRLTFSWLPHRCNLSNQIIWLKYGYEGSELITGLGDPVVNAYWHERNEHIIWTLKNAR